MWIIMTAVGIIIAVFAVLLFIPVRIILRFHTSETASAEITLKIASFTFSPFLKKNEKKEAKSQNKNQGIAKKKQSSKITSALKIYTEFAEDIQEFVRYTAENAASFENIRFYLAYSAGDAALTGILYGTINAAVYSLLGIIHNHALLKNTDINISPQFEGMGMTIDAECIMRIRNAHIIVIVLKFFKLIKKIKNTR